MRSFTYQNIFFNVILLKLAFSLIFWKFMTYKICKLKVLQTKETEAPNVLCVACHLSLVICHLSLMPTPTAHQLFN